MAAILPMGRTENGMQHPLCLYNNLLSSMKHLGSVHLVLFFTRGISLKAWHGIGMLERELAIYRRLRPLLKNITFVTYGDAQDLCYADLLQGISIICNRWRLPRSWYIGMLSFIYPLSWRGPGVFKSNQVQGAEIALKAARRFGKKFIARCGYLPSNIATWRYGMESPEAQSARQLEALVFQGADCIAVTTNSMRNTVIDRYGVDKKRVYVVPNYVDTQRFRPSQDNGDTNHICYVGRLEEEKNVPALLDAIQGLNIELTVIGGGPLKRALMSRAQKESLPVHFPGNVPNAELPVYLHQSTLFIMPSHIEHHPKALLEAMACGLPVIGTDVPGIRQIIQHRDTGYLCGTSPEHIRAAIQAVLSDKDLRVRLGRNAREFVVEHFTLERVAEVETTLLEKVASNYC